MVEINKDRNNKKKGDKKIYTKVRVGVGTVLGDKKAIDDSEL